MSLHQATSTRDYLLEIVNDIDLLVKELLVQLPKSLPDIQKNQEGISQNTKFVVELIIKKENELKKTLKIASKQAIVQKSIDSLQKLCSGRDQEISVLHRHLKDAEHVVTTALYQAKQKQSTIQQAIDNPVSSEELIKFAHRISASYATAAPVGWNPGDSERPYPVDLEMRSGALSQMTTGGLAGANPTSNVSSRNTPLTPTDSSRPHFASVSPALSTVSSNSAPSNASWAATASTTAMTMSGGMISSPALGAGSGGGGAMHASPAAAAGATTTPLVKQEKNVGDDVEVMSTDSSSSSSSDSQ